MLVKTSLFNIASLLRHISKAVTEKVEDVDDQEKMISPDPDETKVSSKKEKRKESGGGKGSDWFDHKQAQNLCIVA